MEREGYFFAKASTADTKSACAASFLENLRSDCLTDAIASVAETESGIDRTNCDISDDFAAPRSASLNEGDEEAHSLSATSERRRF